MDAFYEPLGPDRYRSTAATVGPWDPAAQHAGPPAALLGRALEGVEAQEGWRVARVTVELLRAVPVVVLDVSARVVRPGRSVSLVEASLHADGVEVARATGWRLRTEPVALPDGLVPAWTRRPPVGPQDVPPARWAPPDGAFGYYHAIDWRYVVSDFDRPGPATVWTRLRGAVVAGEEPSALARLLAVADSGNGVSAVLPIGQWQFVNPDLTVAVHRLPTGEWVCLDAATTVEADGTGLAESVLSDTAGPCARGLQSLFVRPVAAPPAPRSVSGGPGT